jgi:hypothetical protein
VLAFVARGSLDGLSAASRLDRAAPLGQRGVDGALDAAPRPRSGGRGAHRAAVCPHQPQQCVCILGDLGDAATYEEELRAATQATGIAAVPCGALAALRGQEAELTELARATVGDAQVRGDGLALTITEFLGGTLNLGLGRYDAVLTAVAVPRRRPGDLDADRADRGRPPVRRALARGWRTQADRRDDPRSGHRMGNGHRVRRRALLSTAPRPAASTATRSNGSATRAYV